MYFVVVVLSRYRSSQCNDFPFQAKLLNGADAFPCHNTVTTQLASSRKNFSSHHFHIKLEFGLKFGDLVPEITTKS